jgi:hypothetical protein
VTANNSPRRVKVEGDYFHGRVPDGAIYVGRGAPGLPGSKWRNRYPVEQYGLDESLRRYEADLAGRAAEVRADLGGKDLACWCPLDQPCHADILLAVAAGEVP